MTTITASNKPTSKPPKGKMTNSYIRSVLELAPELPSGLRWKKGHRFTGKMAGCKNRSQGYWIISINSRKFKTSHIVAMLADLPKWKEMRAAIRQGNTHQLVVDHIDGNVDNNTASNLRVISNRENSLIGRSRDKGIFTSSYRGVAWDKANKRWRARIKVDGHRINLGSFTDELEASKAYEVAVKQYHSQDSL